MKGVNELFHREAATESRPGLTGVVAQAAKRREKIARERWVRVRPCHSREGAADLQHLPPLRGLCPLGNQTQG